MNPQYLFRLLCLAILLGTVAFALPASAQRPEPEVHGEFQGDAMYTLLPPDGIPAIHDPEFVTGEAAAAQMSPTETIMGVTADGAAVCWSTWQLDSHEIVNDTIGDTPIAATW
jgi:Protein of unknown function (DUF3179)